MSVSKNENKLRDVNDSLKTEISELENVINIWTDILFKNEAEIKYKETENALLNNEIFKLNHISELKNNLINRLSQNKAEIKNKETENLSFNDEISRLNEKLKTKKLLLNQFNDNILKIVNFHRELEKLEVEGSSDEKRIIHQLKLNIQKCREVLNEIIKNRSSEPSRTDKGKRIRIKKSKKSPTKSPKKKTKKKNLTNYASI